MNSDRQSQGYRTGIAYCRHVHLILPKVLLNELCMAQFTECLICRVGGSPRCKGNHGRPCHPWRSVDPFPNAREISVLECSVPFTLDVFTFLLPRRRWERGTGGPRTLNMVQFTCSSFLSLRVICINGSPFLNGFHAYQLKIPLEKENCGTHFLPTTLHSLTHSSSHSVLSTQQCSRACESHYDSLASQFSIRNTRIEIRSFLCIQSRLPCFFALLCALHTHFF